MAPIISREGPMGPWDEKGGIGFLRSSAAAVAISCIAAAKLRARSACTQIHKLTCQLLAC
eukprot:1156876-Pelagomonas_calceolata.AAC.12